MMTASVYFNKIFFFALSYVVVVVLLESCLPVDESSGVKAYVIGIVVAVAGLAVVAVVIVAVFVVKKTLATR